MVVMGYVMHWLYTPNVDLTLSRDYYDNLPEHARQLLRCEVVDSLPRSKPRLTSTSSFSGNSGRVHCSHPEV
jgi:hypothetical protein